MRVTVTELSDGSFDLLTDRGHRVGERLITVGPKPGESLPDVPPKIDGMAGAWLRNDRMLAHAACLKWNLYLRWAASGKKKKRISKKQY